MVTESQQAQAERDAAIRPYKAVVGTLTNMVIEEQRRNRELMAANEVASALSTVLERLGDDALAILGYETYTHAAAALAIQDALRKELGSR